MKKLLTLALLLLLGASVDAQKRNPHEQVSSTHKPKKEQQKVKEEPKSKKAELDLNTHAWLREIRVKIYGFDINRKNGKSGC